MIIDLGSRYRASFGYTTPNQSDRLKKLGFTEDTGMAAVEVYVTGDVSFEELELYGNGFDLTFGYAMLTKNGSLGNVFAPPPMISWSRGKRITVTTLDGNEGDVVEKYGTEPWQIKMQGLLIDMENHRYPAAQVRKLREVFEVDAAFEVSGQIFDDLGIQSIYFTNIEISGVQGFADTISFSLDAHAIKPVEAFLKEQSKLK